MHQEHQRYEEKNKPSSKMAIDIIELIRNCIATTADTLDKISAGASKKSDAKTYASGYEDGVRWSLNLIEDAIKKLKNNS